MVARVSGLRAHVASHEDRPARRVCSMAPFLLLKVPTSSIEGARWPDYFGFRNSALGKRIGRRRVDCSHPCAFAQGDWGLHHRHLPVAAVSNGRDSVTCHIRPHARHVSHQRLRPWMSGAFSRPIRASPQSGQVGRFVGSHVSVTLAIGYTRGYRGRVTLMSRQICEPAGWPTIPRSAVVSRTTVPSGSVITTRPLAILDATFSALLR